MSLEDVRKKYKQFINPVLPEKSYRFTLPSLNRLVGGSLRGGRVIQLLGNKSTGKSSLALDLIKNAQQAGSTCAYIDFERTYDPKYAQYLGVDIDALELVKPPTAEVGFAIAEALFDAGIDMVVIDSIAAPVSASEMEKTIDNDNEKMAATAGLITRFIKRCIPKIDNSGALLVLINQNRDNISTLSRIKTKPFGARFIQYASAITIELTRTENGENQTTVQAFVEKNKLGGKERSKCDVTMTYGKGFDLAADVIALAVEYSLVDKKGAWYYNGDIKAQGLEQAKQLFDIPQLGKEINEKILQDRDTSG